ncbi:MAG: DUF1318 domain-containing protein [Chthoniobacterales bacterium]
MKNKAYLLAVSLFILTGGCKTPSVNLTTDAPVKVEIDMRLDVYEHSSTPKATPEKKPNAPKPELSIENRRRNRMADIQTMKNSNIVGENHLALLTIRSEPAGEYAEFVHITVRDENADRMVQMKQMSDEQKIPLPEIQKKQAELWRNRAFQGEEIELIQPDGTYRWIKKE